jgi:hypothetical protein
MTFQIEFGSRAGAMCAQASEHWSRTMRLVEGRSYASSSATMTVPYYVSENKSDMRGIKHGWYAIEEDGALSSGPFASFAECIRRIGQSTNRTMASESQRGPN